MNKTEFLAIVLTELNSIKSKMTQEEISSRLNFDEFIHTERNRCLLYQLTGGRSHEPASRELVPPTFATVEYSATYPDFASFEQQNFDSGNWITGIEKYFYMTNREKHKEVFKFLKGEITEIEL
jgi:hypothetical protein